MEILLGIFGVPDALQNVVFLFKKTLFSCFPQTEEFLLFSLRELQHFSV